MVCAGGRRSRGLNTRRKNGQPLVSIITVVLDRAAPLQLTIDSVIAQTYPAIEYIVIDGGSTDGTLEVIHKHEEFIDYFVCERDNGIFDAINKGLSIATGDFICSLHAADRYEPHAIERMVDLASANPGAIIYTDYYYGTQPKEAPGKLTAAFNLFNMGVAHQTLMIDRNLYERTVGQYRTDFRIVSDHIWMRDAYQLGIPFRRLPEKLLHFDSTGLSSGATAADCELFEAEAARRVCIFFPFVTSDVGRSIFRLRFSDEPLEYIASWMRSMQNVCDHERWPEFQNSLYAYIPFVRERRAPFDLNAEKLRPGEF